VLVVLDSQTGKEITAVPIAGEVDDCCFDARRKLIYAPCGEGFVFVIKQKSADEYEVLAKVPTPVGAKTGLFDPETTGFTSPSPVNPAIPGRRFVYFGHGPKGQSWQAEGVSPRV